MSAGEQGLGQGSPGQVGRLDPRLLRPAVAAQPKPLAVSAYGSTGTSEGLANVQRCTWVLVGCRDVEERLQGAGSAPDRRRPGRPDARPRSGGGVGDQHRARRHRGVVRRRPPRPATGWSLTNSPSKSQTRAGPGATRASTGSKDAAGRRPRPDVRRRAAGGPGDRAWPAPRRPPARSSTDQPSPVRRTSGPTSRDHLEAGGQVLDQRAQPARRRPPHRAGLRARHRPPRRCRSRGGRGRAAASRPPPRRRRGRTRSGRRRRGRPAGRRSAGWPSDRRSAVRGRAAPPTAPPRCSVRAQATPARPAPTTVTRLRRPGRSSPPAPCGPAR